MAKLEVNETLLLDMARLIEPLLPRCVFFGGLTVGLLLTDKAAPAVRATFDADILVHSQNLNEHFALEKELTDLGFSPSQERRNRYQKDDFILDVVECNPKVEDFSNRWIKAAFDASQKRDVGGLSLRVITAPYLLATKIEAFFGRGDKDYLSSHDLEDLIALVDGRPELIEECRNAEPELRAFLAKTIGDFLADEDFLDALPGHLPPDASSQGRLPLLEKRFRELASL